MTHITLNDVIHMIAKEAHFTPDQRKYFLDYTEKFVERQVRGFADERDRVKRENEFLAGELGEARDAIAALTQQIRILEQRLELTAPVDEEDTAQL